MEKKKFYYDEITKTIEVTPFYDEQIEKDLPYIELTFEEWEKSLSCCKYGYRKAFINNEIIEEEDEEVMNSAEYKETMKWIEVEQLKQYLTETDYVIAKLNEAKIEDEELFNSLKLEYANILTKRKEARVRINELEQ